MSGGSATWGSPGMKLMTTPPRTSRIGSGRRNVGERASSAPTTIRSARSCRSSCAPKLMFRAYDYAVAYDEQLAERIRELVSSERGLAEQKMFGGLAFLVGGNMAIAASGQGGLLVRVDPDES